MKNQILKSCLIGAGTIVLFIIDVKLSFAQSDCTARAFGLPTALMAPAVVYDPQREMENFYLNTSGSRYLNDNWATGKIVTTDGDEYSNLNVKYDLWNDKVEVLASNRKVVPNNIEKLVIYTDLNKPLVFKSGFPSVAEYNNQTLYQVLTNGKASLLKKPAKKLQIENAYNNTKATQFNSLNDYYVYKDSQMIKFSRKKSAIATILADKQNQVLAYIEKNSINLKDDTDLEKVIEFYNKL
ncbi:hypothetical protein [Mucilaginibacter sp. PAMB04168]|uniref:hypothetical protein n=1 Tax=Mucilaginibacter sp. PAMB04168 TaxID=3138567 RepID=UPI0031F673D1